MSLPNHPAILTDRHHADLLYSLQLLFEDRLDFDLYVPIGYEWWDAGFWQFGACFGDRRLADQYLQIHDGVWIPCGDGIYTTYDTAHPERPIMGITLEAFRERAANWQFVMATVQENAPGYRKLADEVGATFLYQVGNTGQYIDWDLDPLVLSTSEAPLREGRGIVLHQEIDSARGAFAFHPPHHADRRCVRNAVNAFNRLGPGYAMFTEAERQLDDWLFTVHGHEGRDGDINPVGALGELMKTAGWGWHDKPVGDGFGHVIHSWASVGRPLIGHAGYYAGKLAEPFWQDGVTSLDLGARPLDETIKLLREIAADPDRHYEMCYRMRETFDSLVDYKAEAARVASFLGL